MVYKLSVETGLTRLRDSATHRLDMLTSGLDAELSRFEYLPGLLKMAPVVPLLLERPSDLPLRSEVNRYLKGVSEITGAEMVYILAPSGLSLAASDWDQPGTTLGRNFSFRPYVRDALQNGRGRFYGIGVTSHKPGYYLSYALRDADYLRGIVVVKVDIEKAVDAWRKLPGEVLLLDEHGVVILSTRNDLKFRPVTPLSTMQQAEVARSQQYGDSSLQSVNWIVTQTLDVGARLVVVEGHDYLVSTRETRLSPWQLVVLDDLSPVRSAARSVAVTASLAALVVILVLIALLQRRRAVRQSLSSRVALQAANDSLEQTVAARTVELHAAQHELVHAGKMAMLGQVSMGMVHELNQPLTAIRTLSDSAHILLDQNRAIEVRGNLQRITGLVDRLARLTSQLKIFAHRGDIQPVSVLLMRSIEDARFILGDALHKHGINLVLDITPGDLWVLVEEDSLERVLVNLIQNAIDALAQVQSRTLWLVARVDQGRVRIEVRDSGTGIRADILPHLFEPFVSSKPSGAGLGLGLVISAQLVRAVGGNIQAFNREGGGASFLVELPQGLANE